jgi:hypothetical protein
MLATMAGQTTLIVTTRSGVRPLGVRGEPLHNSAGQLRRIVRRRLGDGAADLLAEPVLHEDGKAIDWYAAWPGEVRRVADLDPARRQAILSDVDASLAGITGLGETLKGAGSGEDTGVVGRSLQLAARRPAETFVFLVGDKPVVVCWGYEKEAASSLMMPGGLPRPVMPAPPLAPHIPVLPAAVTAPLAARASIPWLRTALLALPLLLLLLAGAYLLREGLPRDPDLALATVEGPPAAPAPTQEDRRPLLKASLSSEQARAKALKLEMDTIANELKKRVAECKPAEPPKPPDVPKPPQVASVAPPTAHAPLPAPPPPPRSPYDNRLRLPNAPTNDYSFIQGCWRTDPFRHEAIQPIPGVSSYCFDASGRGELEWRRGRTACRTRAQAQFEGSSLHLRDADTVCNDGSRWYADQLTCQRGADNVAQCSGTSHGSFGPTSWTVNLHKLP